MDQLNVNFGRRLTNQIGDIIGLPKSQLTGSCGDSQGGAWEREQEIGFPL